ncbi:polyhydroxyalkanoate synthesis repressor PhaR [Leucothrix arctica]|uniref:Polyhydroxyalkanoate synthesis repressor PhaR n=1 Tax=Leucothrix arctica TaxID=1481894 RepID=A0A317C9Q9_9GAMM|nr:polyhydroxyalkanoate synthesis regulator DNA-binding domain-containing protein [Leucothrix arctica]PWQ95276.1 hypothetical protein DKT75_13105 [Leucothrix arctica]
MPNSTKKTTLENENTASAEPTPILIKKYPNRRLYNTSTSTYIVLDDVIELINSDTPFIIQDKKTGDDITRSILNQIIFEKEVKPKNYHFSLEVQKQLINMYSDTCSHMVPDYLTESMRLFQTEKNKMTEAWGDAINKNTQVAMEFGQNIARQNIEFFNQSLQIFNHKTTEDTETTEATGSNTTVDLEKKLANMQAELEVLQGQLKSLKSTK